MNNPSKSGNYNYLPFISIILSICVFCYTIWQNSKTNRFAREGIVNSNKPVLIFDSTHSSIKFNLTKHDITKQIGGKLSSTVNDEVQISDSAMHLFQFSVTNKGVDNAKVKGIFILDTTSTNDILRQRILKGQLPTENFVRSSGFEFMEIPSSFSTKYLFDLSIPLQSSDTFTTHVLIIYENDLGYLYDSYFWIKYYHPTSIGVSIIQDSVVIPPKNMNLYFKYSSLDSLTLIMNLGRAYSFYTYSSKEHLKIKSLLKY